MVAMFMRAFSVEYHNEIQRLLKKEAHIGGMTTNGVYYTTDYNTLSGSSLTSVRNSVINAFINYVCIRFKCSKDEAYKNLGMYGGDDGVTRGVTGAELEKTFAMFGMLLKSEMVQQHEPLPFLGRIYLDVWTTPESICDVKRQLSKLHAVVSPHFVPVEVAINRKMQGFVATDYNTPIIKEWIELVKRLYPNVSQQDMQDYALSSNKDVSYWSKFKSPFSPLVSLDLANKVIAENLGISVSELDDYKGAINAIEFVEEMTDLHKKLPIEIKCEITIVKQGEIINGKMKDHQAAVIENATVEIKSIDSVIHKTRHIRPPIKNMFNEPPPREATFEEKKRHEVLKTCNFIMRKEPCPFGPKCKFSHPKTTKSDWNRPQQQHKN